MKRNEVTYFRTILKLIERCNKNNFHEACDHYDAGIEFTISLTGCISPKCIHYMRTKLKNALEHAK